VSSDPHPNEASPLPPRISFAPVHAGDFEELLALRIAAMRESLERVGRFNPERARERLRHSFHPEHSQFIAMDGEKVGFYTLRPIEMSLKLDHLYVHPNCQSRGVGSFVMRKLLSEADTQRLPIQLGALRESRSNEFYQRHGFVKTHEDEWDIYYARAPHDDAALRPEAVVQRQLDAYNAHDVDALLAVYAENARIFEHPATLLASGATQLRERFAQRLAEPNLHAQLIQRIVMGGFVVDHERVTRTFPEGPGIIELIATYEVRDGRIINAWFLSGTKTILDAPIEGGLR
jgi:GNAT superfamily N-acetyltransferase